MADWLERRRRRQELARFAQPRPAFTHERDLHKLDERREEAERASAEWLEAFEREMAERRAEWEADYERERAELLNQEVSFWRSLEAFQWPYYCDHVLHYCNPGGAPYTDHEVRVDPADHDQLWDFLRATMRDNRGADWLRLLDAELERAQQSWTSGDRDDYAIAMRHLLERQQLHFEHVPMECMPGYDPRLLQLPRNSKEWWAANDERIYGRLDELDAAMVELQVAQLMELGWTESEARLREASQRERREHDSREWMKSWLKDPTTRGLLGMNDDLYVDDDDLIEGDSDTGPGGD